MLDWIYLAPIFDHISLRLFLFEKNKATLYPTHYISRANKVFFVELEMLYTNRSVN